MSKHNRERRARRHGGDVLILGAGAELSSVQAFYASRAGQFKPGEISAVLCVHDAGCPYPEAYRECTCSTGPEIRVVGETPEHN